MSLLAILAAIEFAVLLGLVPAYLAHASGRPFLPWWLYGIALPPIALIHAFMIGRDPKMHADKGSGSGSSHHGPGHQCPWCKGTVTADAVSCRHCGYSFARGGDTARGSSASQRAMPHGMQEPKIRRPTADAASAKAQRESSAAPGATAGEQAGSSGKGQGRGQGGASGAQRQQAGRAGSGNDPRYRRTKGLDPNEPLPWSDEDFAKIGQRRAMAGGAKRHERAAPGIFERLDLTARSRSMASAVAATILFLTLAGLGAIVYDGVEDWLQPGVSAPRIAMNDTVLDDAVQDDAGTVGADTGDAQMGSADPNPGGAEPKAEPDAADASSAVAAARSDRSQVRRPSGPETADRKGEDRALAPSWKFPRGDLSPGKSAPKAEPKAIEIGKLDLDTAGPLMPDNSKMSRSGRENGASPDGNRRTAWSGSARSDLPPLPPAPPTVRPANTPPAGDARDRVLRGADTGVASGAGIGRTKGSQPTLRQMTLEEVLQAALQRPGPTPAVTTTPANPQAARIMAVGDLVLWIQRRLVTLGYDPGPVDGMLGPQTQEAIKRYQHAKGLLPSGQIEPTLIEHLGGSRTEQAATRSN